MRFRFLVPPILLLGLQSALGQAKLPIYVGFAGDDAVGRSVGFSLREAIRRSASYELASDEAHAVISVDAISIAPATGYSVISFVGTVVVSPCGDQDMFLHRVLKVGIEQTDEAGRQILSDLDDAWTAAKREIKRRHDESKCEK